jgi:chloride channel protein, CIC family
MSRELVPSSGETIGRARQGGLYMWALAILVGVIVAGAVVSLRTLVSYAEFISFGAARGRLSSHLLEIPWWSRMLGPIVGGALVALLLRLGIAMGWGPAPRAYGLVDVIQNRRLRGRIRSTTLALRDAFLSVLVAIVSLGWGASAGREEPAAHLGASLAVLPGRLLGLNSAARRMLVGMGVSAAIAAALHAPIAGVFLSRELILRNQRLSILGPVAVAAFASWLLTITQFGGEPVIEVPAAGVIPPEFHLAAIVVAPILGAFAFGAVVLWTRAPVIVATAAARIRVPLWLLPFFGGILLGVVALAFPQVMGVGYEPLATGLAGNYYSAQLMPVLALAKLAATAITLSFRFGGGAIAPALYVGAMTGSTMGVVVGMLVGDPAGAQIYFGMLGMAVSLAILTNAPFAAGILVLELSASPAIGVAALVCAFIASMTVRRFTPAPPLEESGHAVRWR